MAAAANGFAFDVVVNGVALETERIGGDDYIVVPKFKGEQLEYTIKVTDVTGRGAVGKNTHVGLALDGGPKDHLGYVLPHMQGSSITLDNFGGHALCFGRMAMVEDEHEGKGTMEELQQVGQIEVSLTEIAQTKYYADEGRAAPQRPANITLKGDNLKLVEGKKLAKKGIAQVSVSGRKLEKKPSTSYSVFGQKYPSLKVKYISHAHATVMRSQNLTAQQIGANAARPAAVIDLTEDGPQERKRKRRSAAEGASSSSSSSSGGGGAGAADVVDLC